MVTSGDDCLRQVAAALESAVRRLSDLVSRYGRNLRSPSDDATEGAIFTAKRMMKVTMICDYPAAVLLWPGREYGDCSPAPVLRTYR
jgi:hypothetical protein